MFWSVIVAVLLAAGKTCVFFFLRHSTDKQVRPISVNIPRTVADRHGNADTGPDFM